MMASMTKPVCCVAKRRNFSPITKTTKGEKAQTCEAIELSRLTHNPVDNFVGKIAKLAANPHRRAIPYR